MVEIKHKDFIGVVPIIPCLNSSWIMGLRIHRKGTTQIPLSSPATKDPGYTGSIRIQKIAKNTKINHIVVSFTNHYNAISIEKLPSKTKIGKYSWYFKNSLLCKSSVSSATKNFLFLLNKKSKYSCSGPRNLKVEVGN